MRVSTRIKNPSTVIKPQEGKLESWEMQTLEQRRPSKLSSASTARLHQSNFWNTRESLPQTLSSIVLAIQTLLKKLLWATSQKRSKSNATSTKTIIRLNSSWSPRAKMAASKELKFAWESWKSITRRTVLSSPREKVTSTATMSMLMISWKYSTLQMTPLLHE